MPNTTPELVGEIIEVDALISVDPFILMANSLVVEFCVDSGPDPAYSVERLELIERNLAAHFYETRDKRVQSEGAGSVSESKVSFQTKLYLDNSQYGQHAQMLDSNGGLAAWNQSLQSGNAARRQAAMTWLGFDYSGRATRNPYG